MPRMRPQRNRKHKYGAQHKALAGTAIMLLGMIVTLLIWGDHLGQCQLHGATRYTEQTPGGVR
jgi:hypothetical protein